jgi:hypothetical protein
MLPLCGDDTNNIRLKQPLRSAIGRRAFAARAGTNLVVIPYSFSQVLFH